MSLKFGALLSDRVATTAVGTVAKNLMPFTIVAWVYPTTLSNGRGIFASMASGSAGGRQWSVRATGALRIVVDMTTTDVLLTSAAILTTNAWWFVATTVNASFVPAIYYGTPSAPVILSDTGTAGVGSPVAEVTPELRVGNQDINTVAWQGDIWLIGYWARALSILELEGIRNWGRSVSLTPATLLMVPGCVYFAVLDGNVAPQIDWTGVNGTGTVTGATTSNFPKPPTEGFRWTRRKQLWIPVVEAAGQPAMRRWGGVPYMSRPYGGWA